jgi:hypothetical protein
MATHWTLGCDAADPQGIAAFWAMALGYVTEPGYDEPDGASIIDPDGVGPAISFLRVPEGKTAKNRMHIDIRVAGKGPWDMAEREQLPAPDPPNWSPRAPPKSARSPTAPSSATSSCSTQKATNSASRDPTCSTGLGVRPEA